MEADLFHLCNQISPWFLFTPNPNHLPLQLPRQPSSLSSHLGEHQSQAGQTKPGHMIIYFCL